MQQPDYVEICPECGNQSLEIFLYATFDVKNGIKEIDVYSECSKCGHIVEFKDVGE